MASSRGRPRSKPDEETTQVAMRLAPGLVAAIDKVREQLSVERFGAVVSRTDAMKTLLYEALNARGKAPK